MHLARGAVIEGQRRGGLTRGSRADPCAIQYSLLSTMAHTMGGENELIPQTSDEAIETTIVRCHDGCGRAVGIHDRLQMTRQQFDALIDDA
jgi:hypothetical protein